MPHLHRSRTFVALIAIGVGVACAADSAPAQTQRAMSAFGAIDSDHDSKLDRGELAAAAGKDFDRLDVDRDGYLTRDELARTRSKTLLLPFPGRLSTAAAFAAADTDHDRKIDKREYQRAVVAAYMRCDRNRDGTIELSDLNHCRM